MVLARMAFGWSVLAHGGVVAGLLWLAPGTPSRQRLAPPMVQMEWRQAAAEAWAIAPLPPAVVSEPEVDESVVEGELLDEAAPIAETSTAPAEPDSAPDERRACPSFEEMRRPLRRAAPANPEPIAVSPPASAAEQPLARVLVPVAGSTIAPRYPASARRAGQQGTVLLTVTVAADGSVTRIAVARSSGHAVLDEEAVRTVRQWRFDGGPGECDQAIEFRLRKVLGDQ